MAYHVELHCDVGKGYKAVGGGCYTHRAIKIAATAKQRFESLDGAIDEITAKALRDGWKYQESQGWACPACLKGMTDN